MCGICGFWAQRPDAERLGYQMAARMKHRGPDSAGSWSDAQAGVTLAHRRLAVVDLSPGGYQPMASGDGRFEISYNGEIYNHLHLRAELEAEAPRAWLGHSDTETLLEAFSSWGIEKTLRRSNGMFAMALWDRKRRELHLARDRLGEKPLYWGRLGGEFVFASELKALRAHPHWTGEIDRDVLTLFFRHNYIPGHFCIHRGLNKLPPGHWLTVSEGGANISGPQPYWLLKEAVESGGRQRFEGSDSEAVDALEALLRDAVGLRMMADVPLGAFLSGGYDSSTVVALMQAQSPRPVKTFSIGFQEANYNEAPHAKAVAAYLGTDHTELYVDHRDAMDVIPELANIWDEPFSDSSQIPTLLVSRLARSEVTVSLSGDGGDELFCGYRRYVQADRLWAQIGSVPTPIRHLAGLLAGSVPRRLADAAAEIIPERLRVRHFGDRLSKIAELLKTRHPEELYHLLVSHSRMPEQIVVGATEPRTLLTDSTYWPNGSDFLERMMYLDLGSYLPDDILVKVDRASMAASLESRVPLLDHRVVEFACSLPMSLKLRGGTTKWVLREALHRHVPREIMERPKMGFGVPIEDWLGGPLRNWAGDLLSEDRLKRDGYLNSTPIRKMWDEHLSGNGRWHYQLWDVLMFQSWLDTQRTQIESDGA